MPSDRSRTSDDLRQNYKAVVTQQGRVILDRDFNALQETVNGALSADATDIIGPCGTPDNGFEISLEQSSPPPTLWSPPAPLSPPAAFEQWDFLIAPGTMYIGGQRGVFPARSAGQTGPFSYSYFDQPDWINPTAPSKPVSEVIWLRFFDYEAGAVEDPDLLDVALGGPDTTQRVRLMRRVERSDGTACADAAKHWNARGYQLDPTTMRLVPQVALKVSFPAAATAPNPCDPVATGGYIGAFNQLIRVEARNQEGGSPTLLWGYDNASFLYRVTAPGSAGTTLTLAQAPVDAFHQPLQNQVVEVLRMAAVLANDPNAIDPTQPILRCVAEARGHVTTLSQSYVPNPDGTGTVQVASLPPEYSNDLSMGRPLFLRVWQGQASGNLTAAGGVELVGFDGKSTSLFVTLTVPSGGTIPDGAFWMIAVRPSTPQLVYPERFLASPQPPDGPSQWMCPLAVINWSLVNSSPPSTQDPVQDCRNQFQNLTGLSKRQLGGCCARTVRPEDLAADPSALQTAVDQFANAGQGAAICLTPGDYLLSQPLKLDSRHSGLTIEACHGGVTIRTIAKPDSLFANGLFELIANSGVTLKGLSFEPPSIGKFPMVGIRLLDCANLTVIGCQFILNPSTEVLTFATGILATGDCSGLSVKESLFTGPARHKFIIIHPVGGGEIFKEGVVDTGGTKTPAGDVKTVEAAPAEDLKPDEIERFSSVDLRPAASSPPAAAGASAQRLTVFAAFKKAASIPNLIDTEDPILGDQAPVTTETREAQITLMAFLMMPEMAAVEADAEILAQAVLDEVEFVDNRMQGLTVAILGIAAAGMVRIANNTISDCIGGIWLAALNTNNQEDTIEFGTLIERYMQQGSDVAAAMERAIKYPLPQKGANANRSLIPRLHIVDNQIEALPGDGSLSGPACLICVMPPLSGARNDDETAPPESSLILFNSNEALNLSDPNPTGEGKSGVLGGTVLLTGAGNTIVDGNLIRNNQTRPANGRTPIYSLFISPGAQGTMAAAGNILKGTSSLTDTRPDVTFTTAELAAVPNLAQLTKWQFLNSSET